MALELVPITLKEARDFVAQLHRHHPSSVGGRFAIGAVPYTLLSEGGTSLRAAGWTIVAAVKGREWDTPTRPRVERAGVQTLDKVRWEVAG
jgi:hypothetical protein